MFGEKRYSKAQRRLRLLDHLTESPFNAISCGDRYYFFDEGDVLRCLVKSHDGTWRLDKTGYNSRRFLGMSILAEDYCIGSWHHAANVGNLVRFLKLDSRVSKLEDVSRRVNALEEAAKKKAARSK